MQGTAKGTKYFQLSFRYYKKVNRNRMFYLVKETMGSKRCIDQNADDIYEDDHFYDCLKYLPWDSNNKKYRRSVRIRCISSPAKRTVADIYSD